MDLIKASRNGDVVTIKRLLSEGVDVNFKDDNEMTSLMFASVYSNNTSSLEIVKLLLDNGANVNDKNNKGHSSLMISSEHSNSTSSLETVKLLLDNGADVDAKSNQGATSLMFASRYSTRETVKLILDRGANINAKSNIGSTSLMFASRTSNSTSSLEIVKLLLDRDANVNDKDNKENTSLMVAANYINTTSSIETIELLLERGADLFDKNVNGRYALDFCNNEACREIISKSMWNIMNKNTKLLSKQYASTQVPKDIWELILLRNKHKALCKKLTNEKNKYILMAFAETLDIPITKETTKRDLCELISKQISWGGKYSEESVKYIQKQENKKHVVLLAKSLGINVSQPINKILDDMGKLV